MKIQYGETDYSKLPDNILIPEDFANKAFLFQPNELSTRGSEKVKAKLPHQVRNTHQIGKLVQRVHLHGL